jgi:DNA-binding GntR family transcriptional regulator
MIDILPQIGLRERETRPQAPRTYQALRSRIVLGELAPLTKLKIAELAEELDVSPGAVREALSQLTTDGLVEARDQRGFRVAPISLSDLDDLTETRVQIEKLALGQAIDRGDAAWEDGVRAALADMAAHLQMPSGQSLRDLQGAERHARFHAALVAGCCSPTLLRIRSDLYDHAERYRVFALRRAPAPRPVADEHTAIAAAALARQKPQALKAAAAHIRLTTKMVRAALQHAGDILDT